MPDRPVRTERAFAKKSARKAAGKKSARKAAGKKPARKAAGKKPARKAAGKKPARKAAGKKPAAKKAAAEKELDRVSLSRTLDPHELRRPYEYQRRDDIRAKYRPSDFKGLGSLRRAFMTSESQRFKASMADFDKDQFVAAFNTWPDVRPETEK